MIGPPLSWTADSVAADVRARRRSAVDVCEMALARIAAIDSQAGAFLELSADSALEAARRVDEAVRAGRAVGPLAGVPVAIKDSICTLGTRTTCGSRMLADFRSPFDATAVARLRAAGAVILGKTNLDEFAMGSSTENSALRQTRNPWDASRVPGGSSGGSAVAVAARMTPLALGSDTGGSIRQPAALCGVVGMKPTYGRVSRHGLVAFGSSLDQIGPLAVNVTDAAIAYDVMAGADPHDATSLRHAVEPCAASLDDESVSQLGRSLRIGVPREYVGDGLDRDVAAAIDEAISVYRKLGATVRDVSLPHAPYSVPVYYLVATAECSSNLARFDGVRYGHRTPRATELAEMYAGSRGEALGAEVKRRIMLGTFALSSGYYDQYYAKALRVRRLICEDFRAAFETCDVLLSPTSPTPAFRIGERVDDPVSMYLADVDTVAVSLAGLPAISIPCGFSAEGLPIGLQLIAPLLAERRLFQTARLFERETDWNLRTPPMAAQDAA